ncbi:translational elongation factor EF-1 alpha, partial [Perkinsus olseni]
IAMSVSTTVSVPITFHPKTSELLSQHCVVDNALSSAAGAGAAAAEKALLEVVNLCQEYSHSFEPIGFALLPQVFLLHAHKKSPVVKAAKAAADAIIGLVTEERSAVAVALVKDVVVDAIKSEKYQAQQAALIALTKIVKVCGVALSMYLDEILPVVCTVIHHIKAPVKQAARECLEALCLTN